MKNADMALYTVNNLTDRRHIPFLLKPRWISSTGTTLSELALRQAHYCRGFRARIPPAVRQTAQNRARLRSMLIWNQRRVQIPPTNSPRWPNIPGSSSDWRLGCCGPHVARPHMAGDDVRVASINPLQFLRTTTGCQRRIHAFVLRLIAQPDCIFEIKPEAVALAQRR